MTHLAALFDTVITYAGQAVETASFDVALLDLAVQKAATVGSFRLNLMTSPAGSNDPASCLTWSDTVAQTAFSGERLARMHFDDFAEPLPVPIPGAAPAFVFIFRPQHHMTTSPIAMAVDHSAPLFHVHVELGAATLECINFANLDLEIGSIVIDVDLGFDGTVAHKDVSAQAEVRYKGTHLLDAGSLVAAKVGDQIDGFLGHYPTLPQMIETFFVRLLRLDQVPPPAGLPTPPVAGTAHIRDYRVEGGRLLVDYTMVSQRPVQPR